MNIFQEVVEKLNDVTRIVSNRIFQKEGLDGVKKFEREMERLQNWESWQGEMPDLLVDPDPDVKVIFVEIEVLINEHLEKVKELRKMIRAACPMN